MKNTFLIIIVGLMLTVSCSDKANSDTIVFNEVFKSRFLKSYGNIVEEFVMNEYKYESLFMIAKDVYDNTNFIVESLVDSESQLDKDIYNKLKQINETQLKYLGKKDFERRIILNSPDKIKHLTKNNLSRLEAANYLYSDNCYLLTELLNKKGEGDITFNSYVPVILENSNKIKVGDLYSAKIYLAAYDSTQRFVVKTADDDTLIVDRKGCAYYKFQTSKKGKNEFSGKIQIKKNDDYLMEIPFKKDFYVE